MMRQLMKVAVIVLFAGFTIFAQPSAARQAPGIIGEIPQPPRPREGTKTAFKDEAYTSEGAVFFFRQGNNIPLPIPQGGPLRLGLDGSAITTAKMEDLYTYLSLPVHSPIQSLYGPILVMRETQIETRIRGNKSGALKRAVLLIEPQTLRVEIGELDYVQVGEKDGEPVYLKPGKWTFTFHCSLQSIEAEGFTWKAKTPGESAVTGGRFGSAKQPISDEQISPLLFFNNPAGTLVYAIVRMGSLVGLIFHRPNITLSPATELHFLIDRIEATYVAPPAPKLPAKKAG